MSDIRLPIAIHRGNAVSLLGTLPATAIWGSNLTLKRCTYSYIFDFF